MAYPSLRLVLRFLFLVVVVSILLFMTGCNPANAGGGGSSTPAAPTGVAATAGHAQVTITWPSVTGATSYNLYWSTTNGVTIANGTKIAGVTSPYNHTSLTNGTTYYYVVTAVNASGESAPSSQVSATPVPVPTYTVTYDGNNNTGGGSAPTDNAKYPQGATVTVLGNTGTLVNAGYAFAGWNTKANGSGTSYAAGATFSMGAANVSLFAVWIPSNLKFSSSGTSITITGYTTVSGLVTIPGGVTGIGDSAFSSCTALTGVTIPSSVTSIGQWAFEGCTGLTSATIPSGVTSISLAAFAGSGLTSVTISYGVSSIGQDAFGSCLSLGPSVTIPSSVTSIGLYAFYDDYSLTNVYVQATTPPALPSGSMAFYGISNLQILVPSGSVSTYKTATGWSDYASNIVSQ